MFEEIATASGYPGLFAVSFLAATLIPLGSEAAVAALVLLGYHPVGVWAVASSGNFLGALANYGLGSYGGKFILSRYLKTDENRLKAAKRYFSRWGSPVLFFAWVPLIGDPITIAAGVIRVHWVAFTLWVFLGKALRYVLVIVGAQAML